MRTLKLILKSLITLLIFSEAGGTELSRGGPSLGKVAQIGIGAFCEGEQEKYHPNMGQPYATHGIFFAGGRGHLLIPSQGGKKLIPLILGDVLLEGYVGKLENMCTVRLPLDTRGTLAGPSRVPLVSVYADHSLGFKVRGSKVIYRRPSSSVRAKLRGELLYGIGHLTKVERLGKYTKADGLRFLRGRGKEEGSWEDILDSGLGAPYAGDAFRNYLSLKRVTVDLLVENDLNDRITTSIGVYSRWGEWKVGNPLSVGVFGKEYSFKDTLGTAFNVSYRVTDHASLNMDSHIGRSKNVTVSFKYDLL